MKNEIVSEAAKHKLLLSPDALELLDSAGIDPVMLNTVLSAVAKNTNIASKKDIEDFLSGEKGLLKAEKAIAPRNKKNTDVRIIPNTDITGNSTCTGTVKDFATYVQARYKALRRIIEKHPSYNLVCDIATSKGLGREVFLVGIIYEVNVTKNGHLIIELEDMTGTCKGFIGKDSPLRNEVLVTDEVIGVVGKYTTSGLFIINQIIYPDLPEKRKWNPSDSQSCIAFASDIHVGSAEFLEQHWDNMTSWMRRNSEKQNIDYILFAGDVVDGIGVYPDQDKDLIEKDIYSQYEMLSELLKDLPDNMQVIVQPGNHDACRLAEPQPALSSIYTKKFDSNIILAGNPTSFDIEGRVITSYHGKSFDDWISCIRGAKYENPLPIMQQMLVKRHLAPIYGKKNALAPEKEDYLAMVNTPDILVTGHIHSFAVGEYRGTQMINSSTYQAQTSYQKEHNFNPIPSKMPICHLGTGRVVVKDFRK